MGKVQEWLPDKGHWSFWGQSWGQTFQDKALREMQTVYGFSKIRCVEQWIEQVAFGTDTYLWIEAQICHKQQVWMKRCNRTPSACTLLKGRAIPDVTGDHVAATTNHKAVLVDLLQCSDDSSTRKAYHVSDWALPEEGGLYNANGGSIPTILLCHGQDGNAHIHPVHVTKHKCYETQCNDGPPSLPSTRCANSLQLHKIHGWSQAVTCVWKTDCQTIPHESG